MKTKRNFIQIFTVLGMAAIFTFSSCQKEDEINVDNMAPTMDIAKLVGSNPEFSILEEALAKANLVDALTGSGPFTVFAPTNDAFIQLLNDLGASSLDDISTEVLTNVLLYHVVGERLLSTNISSGYINTLSTGPGNNNISLYIDFNTSYMKDAVTAGSASNVFLNRDASVINVDNMATNGVVHTINKVLLPPSVVDIALANNNFSILAEAVAKAGLVETLMGEGPFTIFAPTNAAFEALFAELKINSIQGLSNEVLIPVLLYHVVSGNVRSTDLSTSSVATLNGNININVGSSVKINGSVNVILADVQGANGVIHAIDKVLMP
jgi:transforming growth factor-beta-induced protein